MHRFLQGDGSLTAKCSSEMRFAAISTSKIRTQCRNPIDPWLNRMKSGAGISPSLARLKMERGELAGR
jgi:hypothetical protein